MLRDPGSPGDTDDLWAGSTALAPPDDPYMSVDGAALGLSPEEEAAWNAGTEALHQVHEDARRRALVEERTRHHIVDQLARQRAAEEIESGGTRKVRLTPASDFKIKPVRWLWAGRMPLGELTLVAGREGVGKSTFFATLAATITRGKLPGEYEGQPRAVLYAASEDSWEYTIAPRMLVAGADLSLVFRVDVETVEGVTGLVVPKDLDQLGQIAEEHKAAVLMLDPLISMLDSNVGTVKPNEVRRALEPLRRMAEEARVSVAGLVHFNKGDGTDVLTRIAGTRAFAEVARAAIALARDDNSDDDESGEGDDPAGANRCVMTQVKNNLGLSNLPSLAYTIQNTPVDTDEGPAYVGRLRWLGESKRNAEDLITGQRNRDRAGQSMRELVEWVSAQPEPVRANAVVEGFPGDMQPAAIRQALSRAVKRRLLSSPVRGYYHRPIKENGEPVTSGASVTGVTSHEMESVTSVTSVEDDESGLRWDQR